MAKSNWMPMGTVLKMNAINYPDKLGWQDKVHEYTFKQWNDRSCRLANGLIDLGGEAQGHLRRDRLQPRRVDGHLRGAAAKGGQAIVPIMFRLAVPFGDRVHSQTLRVQGLHRRGALR